MKTLLTPLLYIDQADHAYNKHTPLLLNGNGGFSIALFYSINPYSSSEIEAEHGKDRKPISGRQ